MDFQARYVVIRPSSPETLEVRLKASGKNDKLIQQALKDLPAQLDCAKVGDLFNTVITNDDLDASVDALSGFLYGEGDKERGVAVEDDTAMENSEESSDNKEDGAEAKEAATTGA